MNDALQSAEALLLAAYREQATYYAGALRLAEHALGDPGQIPPSIIGYLDKIAAVEARIHETKSWWLRTGRKAGADLRAALDEVARLIDRLAGCVREAEQTAAASRQAMAPELDAAVRGIRMRRAYAGAQASLPRSSYE